MDNGSAKVKVWDIYIRAFHWLLLICILVSFISFRLDEMDIHFISGHCILALLIFSRYLGPYWVSHRTVFQLYQGPRCHFKLS